MLKATDEERQRIVDYFLSQSDDGETVDFVQKVYFEQVNSLRHEIWDLHTPTRRWWLITEPTNLYAQDQFPNMDLALTFHVGLALRIPRSDRPTAAEAGIEPFLTAWRGLEDARDSFDRAEEAEDFQGVGMRCREALVSLVHAAQSVITLPIDVEKPKKSDVRAWCAIIANTLFPGDKNQDRRALLKSAADSAWQFTNWLTHAKGARLTDAQAALQVTECALELFTSALIRSARGVPEQCPSCKSYRLSPERAFDPDHPEDLYERPACAKCGWTGTPVRVDAIPPRPVESAPASGECAIMTIPLRESPNRKRP